MNRPRLNESRQVFFLSNESSASRPCANVQVAGYSIFVTAQLCSFQKLGAEVSCAWCSFNLVFKAIQMCCCSSVCTFCGWVYPYTSLHRNPLSARAIQVRVKSSNLEHVVRSVIKICNVVVWQNDIGFGFNLLFSRPDALLAFFWPWAPVAFHLKNKMSEIRILVLCGGCVV